jgi:transketolase
MFGMANGLGLNNKIAFTNTFSAFCLRAAEQIRLIAINRSNVKISGHHAGISLGADGVSQMCETDIAFFRSLPNFTVVVPCDALETQKAVDEMIKINGPCYLRLGREPCPIITHEYSEFYIGKANILKDGDDVLIVACGLMVAESLKAAKLLSERGINAAVMNMHTIKPLDKETLLRYSNKTKAVVTAEEHSIYGGLGSAVCEALSLSKIPIKNLGIKDLFGESGKPEELFEKFGLTAENIMEYCIDVMKFKEKDAKHEVRHDVKEVDDMIKDINHKPANEDKQGSKASQSDAQAKGNGSDPRGRIRQMSEHDKAKVDAVLNRMFGGRKNS